MTCENNIMGSKNKSTKGMLLSVGMWMMISYSTFYASEPTHTKKNIEEKKNEVPKIIEKNTEEQDNKEEEIIFNEKPIEEENIKKLIHIKEEIKIEKTASPSEIIYKVLSESKELKECIKAIEKKNKEFKVKYARSNCRSGSILDARITDKQTKAKMAVKDIVSQVLFYNGDNKSLKLKDDNNTMAKKTNIYNVLENTIKTINEANKEKLKLEPKPEEKNNEYKEEENEEEEESDEEEEKKEEEEPKEENNEEEEKKEEEEPKEDNKEEEKNEGEEHEEEEDEDEE